MKQFLRQFLTVFGTIFETNLTLFETNFTIFETTCSGLVDFTKGQWLWQRIADPFCSCLRPVLEKFLRQFLKHILQFLGQFLRLVVVWRVFYVPGYMYLDFLKWQWQWLWQWMADTFCSCLRPIFETVFVTIFETIFKTVFETVFGTCGSLTSYLCMYTHRHLDFPKGQWLWQRMADPFCGCLRPTKCNLEDSRCRLQRVSSWSNKFEALELLHSEKQKKIIKRVKLMWWSIYWVL